MKRMLLLGAAALGLLPVRAQAHDYRHDRHDDHRRYEDHSRYDGHHHRYEGRHEHRRVFTVMYRRDLRCGWVTDASYGCREDADRAIYRLSRCGYETRICD